MERRRLLPRALLPETRARRGARAELHNATVTNPSPPQKLFGDPCNYRCDAGFTVTQLPGGLANVSLICDPSGNFQAVLDQFERYGPEYAMLQQKMKEILQKEDDLQEIVQLVGKDSR